MKLTFAEPLLSRVGQQAIRLLARTWRFRVSGAEPVAALIAQRRPYILALWHSRILPLLLSHRDQGNVLLIINHRDGGHLARLRLGTLATRRFGAQTNRGGEMGLLGPHSSPAGRATSWP